MYLKTKNLTKSFSERTVVDNLELDIRPGQILGLLGPNGAGKSTTIKMLSGQLKPNSGTITIDDKEYGSVPDKFRGSIGVMPQEVIIWEDLNIRENLEFTASIQRLPKAKTEEMVNQLIAGLQLEKEINTLGRDLSGGYKRRVNLANSLVHDPSLIFLDEPSPGVDAQTRRFLWEFIEGLRDDNHAVVLTDHYLEEAEKLSDYVVIIDDGKVIAEGTVSELKNDYGKGAVIKVGLASKQELDKKKLSKIVDDKDSNVELKDKELVILTDQGYEHMQVIIKQLEAKDIKIEQASVSQPSLEDIFLLLTGKEIRE